MNKWLGIGRFTKNPELTRTPGGTSISRFTIAISRRYENKNGEKETDYINCKAYSNIAENINKYCKKGDKIYISGTIQGYVYEKNKTNIYTTEVVVEEIEFLEKLKSDSNNYNNQVEGIDMSKRL